MKRFKIVFYIVIIIGIAIVFKIICIQMNPDKYCTPLKYIEPNGLREARENEMTIYEK